MNTAAVETFWDLARRDAAVQQRVVAASEQDDPLQAMAAVAVEVGIRITPSDLARSLGGELTDSELDAVVGGGKAPVGGPRSLGEAVNRRLFPPEGVFTE